jgi:hypothetical protein
MTRQRRLKRRIRARMAKTGESYSTARRQVLRRLGNGAPVADQPEASEARRWHRARIGAVGLVLAVAVAGAVIVATQRSEGPTDRGPSTASTSENRQSVGGPVGHCRRLLAGQPESLARLRSVLRDLQARGATPRDVIQCVHLGVGPRVSVTARSRLRLLMRVPAPRTRRLGESVVVPVPAPRTRRLGEA